MRLRLRPFAALLTANLISVSGNALTAMGLPWFVLTTTGSAARAGVVAFCAMAPVVLSSTLAGPVVDRWGRRRAAVLSDISCGVFTAAVPLLQSAGMLRFWVLCLCVGLAGFCHAPGDTARSALVPDAAAGAAVPLGRAAGLFDGASRCAGMLGAVAGGVLITALGPSRVLLVDAATFVVSAGVVGLVGLGMRGVPRTPLPKPVPVPVPVPVSAGTYRAELAEGIRAVVRTPLLAGICVTTLAAQGLDPGLECRAAA